MAAIAKILLLIMLAVGAVSLAGCKHHRFRHHPRNCSCCRIDVVDYDLHRSEEVDVYIYRPRPVHHGYHHRRNRCGRR